MPCLSFKCYLAEGWQMIAYYFGESSGWWRYQGKGFTLSRLTVGWAFCSPSEHFKSPHTHLTKHLPFCLFLFLISKVTCSGPCLGLRDTYTSCTSQMRYQGLSVASRICLWLPSPLFPFPQALNGLSTCLPQQPHFLSFCPIALLLAPWTTKLLPDSGTLHIFLLPLKDLFLPSFIGCTHLSCLLMSTVSWSPVFVRYPFLFSLMVPCVFPF